MSLDLGSVGFATEPHPFSYDFKTVVLYALGIGAKKNELDYLYEARGPKVFPTFAVVPTYPVMWALLEKTRASLADILHNSQTVRVLRPIPPSGTLRTVGRIAAIYDLKRLAQIVLTTQTEANGEPCCETECTMIVRNAGGFGGGAPPKPETIRFGDAAPAWTFEELTSPEQALLYRLSGDHNPLHADPEVAARVGFTQGPILHGLCTYGFLARAVIHAACGGDASRLKALSAQFRKPVWPGDLLRTEAVQLDDGRFGLRMLAAGRTDPVITNAWAEIA